MAKKPLVYWDDKERVIVFNIRDDPENDEWLHKLRKMKVQQKLKEEADSGEEA